MGAPCSHQRTWAEKDGAKPLPSVFLLLGHEVSKQPLRYATVGMTILLKVQISNSSTAGQGTNLFGPNKIVIPTVAERRDLLFSHLKHRPRLINRSTRRVFQQREE
jgi:hypothetical protein